MIVRKMVREAWACAVAPQAEQDAKDLGLPPYLVEEIIQQFYQIGDCVHPEYDTRCIKLVDPRFGGNKYRMRLSHPGVLQLFRSLLIDVEVKSGHVLVLAGIYMRNDSTYDDALGRCSEMGL